MTELTPADLEALKVAKRRLEHPSLAARLTQLLGQPIEKGFELLPAGFSAILQKATHRALDKALNLAVSTMNTAEGIKPPSSRVHTLAAGASGAAGGVFGLASLPVELPISTVIMLRSIADIARAEGEDLSDLESRFACLEVFALGGHGPTDAAETGYYAVRAALGKAVSEAMTYIAERGALREGAPALMRFLVLLAERFGVVVTEKAAATLVPVAGAVGGAVINVAFIDHFQDLARGHFTVRRLERQYGAETVRSAYQRA